MPPTVVLRFGPRPAGLARRVPPPAPAFADDPFADDAFADDVLAVVDDLRAALFLRAADERFFVG